MCQKRCALEILEEKISHGFGRYGNWASHHPVKLIVMSAVLSVAFSFGLANLRLENDLEETLVPIQCQARQDRATIESLFPARPEADFLPYQFATSNRHITVVGRSSLSNDTVLQERILDEIERLSNFVQNQSIVHEGEALPFKEVCALNDGKCFVSGSFLYGSNFRRLVVANNVPDTIPIKDSLGGVSVSSGKIIGAKFFRIVFFLRQDSNMTDASDTAEDEVMRALERFRSEQIEIAYTTSSSLNKEVQETATGDVVLFAATFAIMVSYVTLMTFSRNRVGGRTTLALLGILSTCLGLVGGLGLVCATGLGFVQIVGATPFLLIGVGVDDVLVLMSGLAESYDTVPAGKEGRKTEDVVADRLRETMRTSGVSVTITTLTNVLSLVIGVSSDFVFIRNFCVYAGACFLLAYLNHLTFFLGCMALHERRVLSSRNDLACCSKVTLTAQEAKEQNKGCCYVLCCTGSPPASHDDVESKMEYFPRWALTRTIDHLPVRVVLIIAFAGLIGIGAWGAVNFQSGFDTSELAENGSIHRTFFEWNNYFEATETVMVAFREPLNYHDAHVQSQISDLVQNLKSDDAVDDVFEINWLKEFLKSPLVDLSSLANFTRALHSQFLQVRPDFENDVVFNEEKTEIIASRVYVRTKNQTTTQNKGDSMKRIRNIVSKSGLPTVSFAQQFVMYEQYVVILPSTLQTVGISVLAVLVVTTLFMSSFLMVVLVTLSLAACMSGVFGFMHFWGLTLSPITMIHLILSIGFCVDYVSHTCHAYVVAKGEDRLEKVKHTVVKTASPITHGTLTTVLGLILLGFAKSFFFRSFFQVIFLVIILSAGQALFLLPALLSFVGPRPSKTGPVGVMDSEVAAYITTKSSMVYLPRIELLYLPSMQKDLTFSPPSHEKHQTTAMSPPNDYLF